MSDSEEQVVFKKKKCTKENARSIQNETLETGNEDSLVSLLGEKSSGDRAVGTASQKHTIKSELKTNEESNGDKEGLIEDDATAQLGGKNLPKWMATKDVLAASKYIKAQSTQDFAADICKDYKETGRCVWGNECKFMHDRSERKSSAQLDAIWNKQQEEKKKAAAMEVVLVAMECAICSKAYTRPVVTKCGHFFCESCALSTFKTNPRCVVCNKATDGSFQPGQKKLDALQLQQQQQQQALKDSADQPQATSKLEYSHIGSWGYTKK